LFSFVGLKPAFVVYKRHGLRRENSPFEKRTRQSGEQIRTGKQIRAGEQIRVDEAMFEVLYPTRWWKSGSLGRVRLERGRL
jgi:hypothetical protein